MPLYSDYYGVGQPPPYYLPSSPYTPTTSRISSPYSYSYMSPISAMLHAGIGTNPLPRGLRSYSPMLTSISESGSPLVARRDIGKHRSSPRHLSRSSPKSYYRQPRPTIIDTENLDLTRRRGDNEESTPGMISRQKTIVRMHTRKLKENPELKKKKTQAELLMEKYLIKDKPVVKEVEEIPKRKRIWEEREQEPDNATAPSGVIKRTNTVVKLTTPLPMPEDSDTELLSDAPVFTPRKVSIDSELLKEEAALFDCMIQEELGLRNQKEMVAGKNSEISKENTNIAQKHRTKREQLPYIRKKSSSSNLSTDDVPPGKKKHGKKSSKTLPLDELKPSESLTGINMIQDETNGIALKRRSTKKRKPLKFKIDALHVEEKSSPKLLRKFKYEVIVEENSLGRKDSGLRSPLHYSPREDIPKTSSRETGVTKDSSMETPDINVTITNSTICDKKCDLSSDVLKSPHFDEKVKKINTTNKVDICDNLYGNTSKNAHCNEQISENTNSKHAKNKLISKGLLERQFSTECFSKDSQDPVLVNDVTDVKDPKSDVVENSKVISFTDQCLEERVQEKSGDAKLSERSTNLENESHSISSSKPQQKHGTPELDRKKPSSSSPNSGSNTTILTKKQVTQFPMKRVNNTIESDKKSNLFSPDPKLNLNKAIKTSEKNVPLSTNKKLENYTENTDLKKDGKESAHKETVHSDETPLKNIVSEIKNLKGINKTNKESNEPVNKADDLVKCKPNTTEINDSAIKKIGLKNLKTQTNQVINSDKTKKTLPAPKGLQPNNLLSKGNIEASTVNSLNSPEKLKEPPTETGKIVDDKKVESVLNSCVDKKPTDTLPIKNNPPTKINNSPNTNTKIQLKNVKNYNEFDKPVHFKEKTLSKQILSGEKLTLQKAQEKQPLPTNYILNQTLIPTKVANIGSSEEFPKETKPEMDSSSNSTIISVKKTVKDETCTASQNKVNCKELCNKSESNENDTLRKNKLNNNVKSGDHSAFPGKVLGKQQKAVLETELGTAGKTSADDKKSPLSNVVKNNKASEPLTESSTAQKKKDPVNKEANMNKPLKLNYKEREITNAVMLAQTNLSEPSYGVLKCQASAQLENKLSEVKPSLIKPQVPVKHQKLNNTNIEIINHEMKKDTENTIPLIKSKNPESKQTKLLSEKLPGSDKDTTSSPCDSTKTEINTKIAEISTDSSVTLEIEKAKKEDAMGGQSKKKRIKSESDTDQISANETKSASRQESESNKKTKSLKENKTESSSKKKKKSKDKDKDTGSSKKKKHSKSPKKIKDSTFQSNQQKKSSEENGGEDKDSASDAEKKSNELSKQSTRLMHFINKCKKLVADNESISVEYSDEDVSSSSEETCSSEYTTDSEEDSSEEDSSNDSECDVNCHRKCEKLMPNLCGVNQKLIVEALSSVRKGSTESREHGSPSRHHNNAALSLDQEKSTEARSFPGRVTPPATTIPKFRKYTMDDFQFLKVLGKGSFGKVLLAELRGTQYYYAVKCLKKDVVLEDDDVECTLIERKVLALGTNHPYLCHLFCTFQTDSHLFFVMEYLNGGDLMFHIQQQGRFDEGRARFYAAEIVSGLKFLHKKGIVYRDLKLDNILLDFDGHVRIADFGMCKLQIYLDRTADTFCGTPDYMAPEIIKGLKYNQCVDWWSFGILLYEMLVGQSPFSGCDEDDLFWCICNRQPHYPRFITLEAKRILTQLLEKDASKRLGSCENGAAEVMGHSFFNGLDWDRLEHREMVPPFKPNVKHPLDVHYFDKHFTTERACLTPIDPSILQSMDQTQFHGFSYTNPNVTD